MIRLLEIGCYYVFKKYSSPLLVLYDLKNKTGRILKIGEGIFNNVSRKPLNLETYMKSFVSLNSNTYVGNIEQEERVLKEELIFHRLIFNPMSAFMN